MAEMHSSGWLASAPSSFMAIMGRRLQTSHELVGTVEDS
jgi:hypothetical protein